MTIHLELRERIERRFAGELARPLELKQDALIVQLRNDVLIELRFAARDEYIINWRWGDAGGPRSEGGIRSLQLGGL